KDGPVAGHREIHRACEAAGRGFLAGKENRGHAWMRHIRLHVDMSAWEGCSRRIREGHAHCGVAHVGGRRLNFMLDQDGLTGVRLILASRGEEREQNQGKNRSECGYSAHYAALPILASLGFHSHVQLAVCGSPSGGNMW